MRKLLPLLLLLALNSLPANAQVQSCVCDKGCTLASNPYPPTEPQPTACTVSKGGSVIGGGSGTLGVQPSTKVLTDNSSLCAPASEPYDPGPAGSVACYVWIPPQPLGSVTVTMTASNAQGAADGTSFTFTNVAKLPLPQKLQPVAKVRVTP